MSRYDDPDELSTRLSHRPDALDLESQPTQLTPAEGPNFPPGSLIANRYRVVRMLGVGGMGVVYRVHDRTVDMELALKVLRPELAGDGGFIERFRNELLTARQVTHRNVVRIHDLGEHEGLYYMSMDLVEGRSLQEILRAEGKLDVERAAAIVRQVADALGEAHRQNVVHRDLKPANILIDGTGNAYVTDFGIARSLSRPGLTRTGEVLGTPDYLSPEQARGEVVDNRSDIYSLGLMFVEMLSGKLPFPGGTLYEVLAQRMTGKMFSLTELGVKVSTAHAAIISRCVAKEPAERYQSAAELVADLDDLRRPERQLRARRMRRAATIVAALLAVGLVVFGTARWLAPRLARPVAEGSRETTETPVATIAQPRFSVAVLPFPEESGREDSAGGDLAWVATGVAEMLAASLAESEDLRVVDSVRVIHRLKDLGFAPGRLRDDQVDQFADVLQVNRLVRGVAKITDGQIQLEAMVVEADQPGAPERLVGSQSGGIDQLFDLAERLGVELRQALGVESTTMSALTSSTGAMTSYAEGLGWLGVGDMSAALPALERAVTEDPDFTTAWVRLAEAYRDLGRREEALDAAKQGVRAAGESSGRRAFEVRAQEALLRGKPDEARVFLQNLVERYPYDVEARIELARAFGAQGRFGEAMLPLRQTVEIDAAAHESWYLLGQYSIRAGNSREAVDDYLIQALILRRKMGDRQGQAEVYNAMGVGYQQLGLLDQAAENYEEAAGIRRQLDDRRGLASTLTNLAWLYLSQGDFAAAEERLAAALDIHTELGNPAGIGEVTGLHGYLEETRGRFPEALELYRRSLQARESLGDQRAIAESRNNVGNAYYLLGEYDNALLNLERALDLHQQNGNRGGVVLTRQSIGFCQSARGQWDEALNSFDEALKLARETAEKGPIAVSRGHLGLVAQYQGRYAEAFEAYREAVEILEELNNQRGVTEFRLREAEALLDLGSFEAAGELLDRLEQPEGGNPEQRAQWLNLHARWHLALDEPDETRKHSAEALVEAEASHSLVAQLQARLGDALGLAAEDPRSALSDLRSVAAEAKRLGHAVLQLRSAEALAAAELAVGETTTTEDLLRDALRVVDVGGSYARAYRLHHLMAEVLTAAGREDAAARQRQQARAEHDKVRGELADEHRQTFDRLPEVLELS